MAISRVPGPALLSNLDRQGLDLQFTTTSTSLVYMDFANFRLGVNTSAPAYPLHVEGNVLVANGHFYTSGDLTYDIGTPTNRWNNIYAGGLTGTLQTPSQTNITSVGTLNGLSVSGNIVATNSIVPSAGFTGNIGYQDRYWGYVYANAIVTNALFATILTAEQPFISELNSITINDAVVGNLSVSNLNISNNFTVTGNVSVNQVDGNLIYEDGYRVMTENSNIVVTGEVVGFGNYTNVSLSLVTTGVTPGVYGAGDDEFADKVPKITVDSKGRVTNIANVSLTQLGNVSFSNTTISSTRHLTITTTGNGNVYLTAPGAGAVNVTGNKAIRIPSGNIATRPSVVEQGYFRFNTELASIEWYDGTNWIGPGDRSSITSDIIIPNGVDVTYYLSANATATGTLVSINGTLQQPANLVANTGSYTIAGNAITFTEPPLATDVIDVRRIEVGVVSIEALSYGGSEVRVTSGNVTVTGNLIPTANVTFNLGSSTNRWNQVYFNELRLTGNLITDTPIPITSGGTGATTEADALENLLPNGEVSGYVLMTGGVGSYFWANANIAGGGMGSGPGTRIDTARLYHTASASQTVFSTPSYVVGSNQLKVFINGVRQFAGAYSETSNLSITFSSGLRAGTQVLTEVDTYQYYTINAANIAYTPAGNISANTVSAALAELDAEKVSTVGDVILNGNLYANSGIDSSSTITGALRVRGGIGATGNVNVGELEIGTTPAGGNILIKKGGFQGIYSDGNDLTLVGGGGLLTRNYLKLTFNGGPTLYGGAFSLGGNIVLDGGGYDVVVSKTTSAGSTTGGALVVGGGIGLGGNIHVGLNTFVDSNVTVGITATANGNLWIRHTNPSTSTTTGALRVTGGAGIAGNLNVGGPYANITSNLLVGSTSTAIGNLWVTHTTPATSISTGALRVAGGASVVGNLYLGGNVILTSGVLGTVTAGEIEYDGSVFYSTQDTTTGRGIVLSPRYFRLTANIGTPAAGQGPGIAWVFGPTSNVSLVANSLYEIEWDVFLFKQAAGTLTWQITNDNNPPQFVHASYIGPAVAGNVAVGTPQFAQNHNVTTGNTALPVTGTITLNTWHRYNIKAILLSNATVGGKIGLQVTQSLGTMVTLAGSTIKVVRLPTAGSTGTFGN